MRGACACRGPEHLLPGGTLPHTAGGARRVAGESVVRSPSPSPLLPPRTRPTDRITWPVPPPCSFRRVRASTTDVCCVCVRVRVKNISFSSLFRFRSVRSSSTDRSVRSLVFYPVVEFFHISLRAKSNIYATRRRYVECGHQMGDDRATVVRPENRNGTAIQPGRSAPGARVVFAVA